MSPVIVFSNTSKKRTLILFLMGPLIGQVPFFSGSSLSLSYCKYCPVLGKTESHSFLERCKKFYFLFVF